MSAYSLRDRLCFVHVPKNAGTAVRKACDALEDFRDFEMLDKKHRKSRDPAFANHYPVWYLEDLLMWAESDIPLGNCYANPLRIFMVVRNPWARMVSLYHHRLRKLHLSVEGKPRNTPEDIEVAQAGFIPWLLSTPNAGDKVLTRRPQVNWGMDRNGEFVARPLRFERLAAEWLDLIDDWNLPPLSLPYMNVSKRLKKDYRAFYNDEARNHVARYFAPDIERFQYVFI